METIRMKEIEIAKSLIKLIVKTGATLVLTTKGIDDLCTKLLSEAGIVAIKRCKKEDLEIIAKYSGTELYYNIFENESYKLGQGRLFKIDRKSVV